MILEQNDAELFYSLWLPLLDFVNIKYNVNPNLKKIGVSEKLDPNEVKAIADFVWSHTNVIDDYLGKTAVLTEEHRSIIADLKRCRPGQYILERNLKKGSVFIDAEAQSVYMVCGIYSSWAEMFGCRPLPVLMKAVLLPFRDKIITDGIVIPCNILFGRGYVSGFRDVYMDAKRSSSIRFSL